MVEKSGQQYLEEANHIPSTGRKQREDKHCCLVPFLHLCTSGSHLSLPTQDIYPDMLIDPDDPRSCPGDS